jgi:hypothetical protein
MRFIEDEYILYSILSHVRFVESLCMKGMVDLH